jgi:hypothetical protein
MSIESPPQSKPKKKLSDLEAECRNAYKQGLIEEYTCNPYLAKPYIFIRFHKLTEHDTKVDLVEYIKATYHVKEVEFVAEGTALYIVYNYWSRYEGQNDDDDDLD